MHSHPRMTTCHSTVDNTSPPIKKPRLHLPNPITPGTRRPTRPCRVRAPTPPPHAPTLASLPSACPAGFPQARADDRAPAR